MAQEAIPQSTPEAEIPHDGGVNHQRTYRRFTPAQRFEHMILILTFSGLALTGLPQRYADQDWAQLLISLMGGIESVRIVHRVLATLLMVEAIYHGGLLTYKIFVLGYRATMLPGIGDLRDAINWVLFNLGLRRSHPKLPRYNFGEKAEYLAVVWGTILMVVTGFMLWNPIATASILPGEAIPAALTAHSGEAFLAVAAIVIWHMYNVHIRRFNRSMFTGNLTHEEMEEEHGAELEAIERGDIDTGFPPEVVARRRRFFIPYAIIMTIILVTGLVWFVTFERTAIETVPGVASGAINLDVDASAGSEAIGEVLWQEQECSTCHGLVGDGGGDPLGVPITDRDLALADFITAVRRGPAEMPAYNTVQIEDEQLADLWVYYISLIPTESASNSSGG